MRLILCIVYSSCNSVFTYKSILTIMILKFNIECLALSPIKHFMFILSIPLQHNLPRPAMRGCSSRHLRRFKKATSATKLTMSKSKMVPQSPTQRQVNHALQSIADIKHNLSMVSPHLESILVRREPAHSPPPPLPQLTPRPPASGRNLRVEELPPVNIIPTAAPTRETSQYLPQSPPRPVPKPRSFGRNLSEQLQSADIMPSAASTEETRPVPKPRSFGRDLSMTKPTPKLRSSCRLSIEQLPSVDIMPSAAPVNEFPSDEEINKPVDSCPSELSEGVVSPPDAPMVTAVEKSNPSMAITSSELVCHTIKPRPSTTDAGSQTELESPKTKDATSQANIRPSTTDAGSQSEPEPAVTQDNASQTEVAEPLFKDASSQTDFESSEPKKSTSSQTGFEMPATADADCQTTDPALITPVQSHSSLLPEESLHRVYSRPSSIECMSSDDLRIDEGRPPRCADKAEESKYDSMSTLGILSTNWTALQEALADYSETRPGADSTKIPTPPSSPKPDGYSQTTQRYRLTRAEIEAEHERVRVRSLKDLVPPMRTLEEYYAAEAEGNPMPAPTPKRMLSPTVSSTQLQQNQTNVS